MYQELCLVMSKALISVDYMNVRSFLSSENFLIREYVSQKQIRSKKKKKIKINLPRPNINRRAFIEMPRHKNNSLLFLRDLMRYEVHALKDAEWKKTRISNTRTRTRDRQLKEALEYMEVGEKLLITNEESLSEDGIDNY
eukprot:snap_masked-scaffold_30-processed-gene-3.94-mRNA-1 protein AED:1.00 eAED:1.00 QI:0/0/0/0/1/1/2/0/139